MARPSRKENAAGSLAITSRFGPEIDAAARIARAPARDRSHRCVEQNCRRIYRRALCARGFARGRTLRPSSSTGLALRAGTGLQEPNPAKTEATLRLQNHPRHSLPRRLILQHLTTKCTPINTRKRATARHALKIRHHLR